MLSVNIGVIAIITVKNIDSHCIKIVDSEYNMDIYKSVKISIGAVMRNQEMSKFVPDLFKTEKICKNTVKKLPFAIRYVLDRSKTQLISDKAIVENDATMIIKIFSLLLFNPKHCVIKLPILITLQYNLFLITVRR